MALPQKSFGTIVSDLVTGWQQQIGITSVLVSGDPLLAIMQSVAAQLVFLESLIQIVANLARASTSTGSDLDTWMADYGFTRLPADYAEGPVALGALSPPSTQILIAPGTVIQTIGGAIQYQIIADTTQTAWSATLNAYVLPAGQTSITASAQALVAGSASNISAGLLSQFASPIPGIDTVTNAASITNGANAETDASFRSRFVLYLAALSKATEAAILSAINGVQAGLDISLNENENTLGETALGQFTAVIDNGSGSPPSSLLNAISAALQNVRAFTVQAQVIGPTVETVTVSLTIHVASGYVAATVQSNVAAAVLAYVNTVDIGATLYVSSIEQAALAVAGVASVKPGATLINGANADYAATTFQVIRTISSDVSVGTY